MTQQVDCVHQGEVAFITLQRPEAGNRLTNAMAAALAAALDGARGCRVIVLRGAGSDFCVGRDMQPPAAGSRVSPLDVMRDDASPMLELFEAFRRARQPVVAAVQGKAWGIGTVFAGLCDVTIAAENASFRLGELERGIPPAIAMSALLDRMPRKALAHLVFSAEEIDTRAALAAGLASRVVEAARLDQALRDFVAKLLTFRQEALEAVKLYLAAAPRHDEARAAQYGASLLSNILASR
jgi:enoyl-CoA hydratase/carnithine racemase